MKTLKGTSGLKPQLNAPTSPGAMEERRHMNRLYLADCLGGLSKA
ncbi:hypothetical protein [Chthoniobacter flavus]|nr:hypothetical protein [Chthoniobacter flavus]